MKTSLSGLVCAAVFAVFCILSFSARAQDGRNAPGMIPPVAALSPAKTDDGIVDEGMEATEGADIRLTPDRSEIIRVPREVGSVVIGNPENLSVFVDTPQSLVLVPKVAGATYFTVLDKTGNVMVERHVIVAAPKRNYVRIRTTCTGENADSCAPTKIYYCPEGSMCHDVPLAMGGGKGGQDKTATELGKLMMKSIDNGASDQNSGGSEGSSGASEPSE